MTRMSRCGTALLLAAALVAVSSWPARAGVGAEAAREARIKRCVERLGSDSARIKLAALAALAEIGGPEQGKAVVDCLRATDDVDTLIAGARALGGMRAKDGVEILCEMITHGNADVRRAAIRALGEIGDKSAVQPMLSAFPKDTPSWLDYAIAFGRIADPAARAAIQQVLEAYKPSPLRARPAAALARVAPKTGLDYLIKMFKGKESEDGFFEAFEAAGAMGEIDSKEAAEFLLDRLGRLQANPLEIALREAITTGLSRLRTGEVVLSVAKPGLKDKHPAVRAAVARGLGPTRVAELVPLLVPLLEDKEPDVRVAAADGLGDCRQPGALDALLPLASTKEFPLRVAVLVALGKIGDDRALPTLVPMLDDPDTRIRYAAANALFGIRTKACVKPLIDLLGKSREWLQKETAGMLTSMTGKTLGLNANTWSDWWKQAEPGFDIFWPEDEATIQERITYWEIEISSDRICFLIDTSGSMSEPAMFDLDRWRTVRSGPKPKDAPKGEDIGPGIEPAELARKIGAAKAELLRSLKTLPDPCLFDVIAYSDHVNRWEKAMQPARVDKKRTCNEKFVQKLRPNGSTFIYEVLEDAFKLAGPGVQDAKKDLACDTIYLLTDGTPWPPSKMLDTEKILEHFRELNKLGRVRINTIGLGQCNSDFLRKLAAQNGGKFVRQ